MVGAARADVGCEAVSGARSSKGEVRYLGELRVVEDQKSPLGDQCSMSSAGVSQKKRKPAVRKNQRKRENTIRAIPTTFRWTETRARRS